MKEEEPKLLNVQKAASFLGVSTATIRQWAQNNKLQGVKVGSRGDWRFTKEELSKMIHVEKSKFTKIKKFLKKNAEDIHTIANKKHISKLGTDNVRIKNLNKHAKETIKIIKEFANHLEDVEKGKIIFEKLAKNIALKSIKEGLTLEESVDGTIFLKQAFWEKLEQEGLLYELTTQDFYTFSNIISTYADIVASKIVFAYHDYFQHEQEKLLVAKDKAYEQEKKLQSLVKFKKEIESRQKDFLAGGGMMGKQMRSKDWTKTVVGNTEHWPQSLRTAVSIVLNSSFPMFVWWDPKHLTNFYNDSYAVILGEKHPEALGKSAKEVWKEIWKDVGPLAKKVISTGKPIFMKNLPLTMNRYGYDELTYFTFSYSPIRDETGKIGGIYCACVETTNEVLGKQKLQESEDRFKTYAEAMPQMAFISDAKGIITYYNQRWYEYVNGAKKKKKKHGKENGVYHPEDIKRTIESWTRSIKTGEPYEIEYRLQRYDGEYRWHLGRAIPMRNSKGEITQWFGTNTDIHEHKQLVQQKDEFIGIASHELKTPVTSIKAYTQVLHASFKKKNDKHAVTSLGKMNAQLNKLTDLIGDLLDVTKIEAGKLQFNRDQFNFDDLVQETVESMQLTTEKHELIIQGDTRQKIYADKDRLGQVMTNLLSNAIKYSPHTKKIIIVLSKENGAVKMCVKDYGIGIPKEKREKVFERFFRVSGPDTQTFPGLGLGLYISNEIIKRLGGRIWVESEKGKGSTFCFILPIEKKKIIQEKNTLVDREIKHE